MRIDRARQTATDAVFTGDITRLAGAERDLDAVEAGGPALRPRSQ
jgi:hypothetical protein